MAICLQLNDMFKEGVSSQWSKQIDKLCLVLSFTVTTTSYNLLHAPLKQQCCEQELSEDRILPNKVSAVGLNVRPKMGGLENCQWANADVVWIKWVLTVDLIARVSLGVYVDTNELHHSVCTGKIIKEDVSLSTKKRICDTHAG